MSIDRIKFIADDNLLRQVITDQAGDWKKGILELLQNAYDSLVMKGDGDVSKYTSIEITTNTNEKGVSTLTFEDSGCGWGKNKNEIIHNMRVFGDSIKRGLTNTIGEKGMGRGQAFAMIYDSSRNEFIGDITVETNGWIIYDVKLSDLSFSIKKGTKGKVKRRGTRWIITSAFRKFDANEIEEYITENIMLPVRIKINGKGLRREIKGKRVETNEAVIYIRKSGGFSVYDRGLYVNYYKLGGIGGIIVTKIPLELNFARNDIVDSDPNWRKIWASALCIIKNYVKHSDVFNEEKRFAAKELIARVPEYANEFSDMPIIKTTQGRYIAPNQAARMGKVYTSEEGSRTADDVIQRGGMVISEGYGALAEKFGISVESMAKSRDYVVEAAKSGQYIEFADNNEEITGCDKAYLELLKNMLYEREIKLGRRRGVLGWTNGTDTIWLSIDKFRSWKKDKPSIASFYFKAIPLVAHEMAHIKDDRETDYHGYDFDQNSLKWIEKLMKRVADMDVVNAGPKVIE